jgi:hypothetical protein
MNCALFLVGHDAAKQGRGAREPVEMALHVFCKERGLPLGL